MKRFFRKSTGKKLVMTLLVLVVASLAAFAAPLSIKGSAGDAKIYDSSYKAVKNPSEVAEGFVVKTANDAIVLSNDSFLVEIKGNSLVQFINLGANVEVYLLDGKVSFTSSSAFKVRTPVTIYAATSNTEIYVISDASEEKAFIGSGSATSANLITKTKTTLSAGLFIDNSKNSFKPADTTTAEFWGTSAIEQVAAEKAAAEKAAAEKAAAEKAAAEKAAAEKAAVEQAAAEPVATPSALTRTFTYAGFSATVEAYIGEAYITYPEFVTDDEINAAAAAAAAKYPGYLQGVYYEFVEPGLVRVTYPEAYGPVEFNYAMDLLDYELPLYIAELFESHSETATAVAQAEPAAAEPVATPSALTRTFTYAGFTATVEAYIGEAYITYPEFVTDDEINAAAAAAAAKYPGYLQGVYYEFVEPGLVRVTYPEAYGPVEFNYAMDLLDYELPLYIAELFAAHPETVTAVAHTEPAAAAAPAATAPVAPAEPVSPAPAQQAAPAEPEKTPIETSPRPEAPAEPVEKEKPDFRFGATIGFVYGLDHPNESYKAFLRGRVGGFGKNLEVIVDPTIYYKNLTFGLHLPIDISLFREFYVVNPFSFDTSHGITGYISSVMKYIGVVGFESESFKFRVDRTSDLDFSSPVYGGSDRLFESENELLATASFEKGNFSAVAFMDDLQLLAKLDNRGQFAGLRADYKIAGKYELGVSALANVGNGFRAVDLYPAFDFSLPFTFGDTKLTFSAGAAAKLDMEGLKGLLFEGKIDYTFKAFTVGVGAAYNKDSYFNNIMNNGPTDIIQQYSGNALDVILSAAIDTKIFTLSAEMSAPLSLGGSSRLAYNTVKTRGGDIESITVDTMNFQADLKLGKFTFSAGAALDGFSGHLANLLKAVKNSSGRRAALAAFADPEYSTYFGMMDLTIGGFNAYVRADLSRVNGTLTIPVSLGVGFTF